MKKILFAVFAAICISAQAFDYNSGQCPAAPAGYSVNCNFSSSPLNATSFADTWTFDLGDWTEAYGVLVYTRSVDVVASGHQGITPCSGRGCRGRPYEVVIDSATIDGVPLTPVPNTLQFEKFVSLTPGPHTMTITGTASGATWYGRWSAAVQGITYTLIPN